AWAGSLTPDVVADTLEEARDNAAFGAPDEFFALAGPSDVDGVAPPALDLWRDDLLTVSTDDKVALALELDRMTRAVDARVRGVESSTYGDAAVEAAIATSLGVEAVSRRTVCSCAAYDAEGVPTRRVPLVSEGRLAGFLHNVYTGRRSGRSTTGSAVRGGFKSPPGVGPRALHLVPGTLTPEELLASVPEALYVQSI